jgi:hypothetical protein
MPIHMGGGTLLDHFDFTQGLSGYKVKQEYLEMNNINNGDFIFTSEGVEWTKPRTILSGHSVTGKTTPDNMTIEFVCKMNIEDINSELYIFAFGEQVWFGVYEPQIYISIDTTQYSYNCDMRNVYNDKAKEMMKKFIVYQININKADNRVVYAFNNNIFAVKPYYALPSPFKFFFYGNGASGNNSTGTIKYIKLYEGNNIVANMAFENKKDLYSILR